jgi:hypothetical protein
MIANGVVSLSEKGVRGLLGVLVDVLNWLRIYRQRDFWIQIAASVVGVFLWIIILPGEEIVGAIAATPALVFLVFVMTNIVWAISRKPYSCILGGSIGYGLYNLAVGAIVYRNSLTSVFVDVLRGMLYGFVFSWFGFVVFYFLGLIKRPQKKGEQKQSQI